MSVQITLDIPEGAFSALKSDPRDFARKLRLAAAVKWYELGLISQSKAAEVAGVSRQAFLESLAQLKVSPFQDTLGELKEELDRG